MTHFLLHEKTKRHEQRHKENRHQESTNSTY